MKAIGFILIIVWGWLPVSDIMAQRDTSRIWDKSIGFDVILGQHKTGGYELSGSLGRSLGNNFSIELGCSLKSEQFYPSRSLVSTKRIIDLVTLDTTYILNVRSSQFFNVFAKLNKSIGRSQFGLGIKYGYWLGIKGDFIQISQLFGFSDRSSGFGFIRPNNNSAQLLELFGEYGYWIDPKIEFRIRFNYRSISAQNDNRLNEIFFLPDLYGTLGFNYHF